ncbi:MAG: hypothetical protein MK033_04700 [Candidatus Caenarcaniphilales bacterium]|nr:hypothetical protein [Candidatus Caenarcaniphilales bacterium]
MQGLETLTNSPVHGHSRNDQLDTAANEIEINDLNFDALDISEQELDKINLHRTLDKIFSNHNLALNEEGLNNVVSLDRSLMNFRNAEDDGDEQITKSVFQKMAMRFARFIDTRPIMKTAIATAIGDDMAASAAGLFRNFSEGVLNFASASEEAFKGVLKFILNISGIGVTESLTKFVANFTLDKHLREDARHLLLIPYEVLDKPDKLAEELTRIQESEPREFLNNMRSLPARDEEAKLLQAYKAKKVFDFVDDFNPSKDDIESIKKFHLAMRFFEGGVKSSLWASVPLLNRFFRSKILGLDSFPGLKGLDAKEEKSSYGPLQKLGSALALSSGFLFHGGVLALNKMSDGSNKFAKAIINRTGFSHGVFPTDEMNFINQGLAYDFSRLVNSQGKSELFESGMIAGLFTPILYFGHKLMNFMGVAADQQLASKHSVDKGILAKNTDDMKIDGIQSLINKYLPSNATYKDFMPKVDHDKELTHDAKVLHANSTIAKLLSHSMIVLATRIFVNNRTKAFATSMGE